MSLLRELLQEARHPDKKYTIKEVKKKIDRVTVQLESHASGSFTKLAKKYKEIDDQLEILTAKRNALNVETKEHVLDLFDAEDEVLTRVVETVSMTATMSKLSQPTPKIDSEKVIAALLELMPELSDKIKELQHQFTTIPAPKSPALSVKINEGFALHFVRKMKSLLNNFRRWGKSFDKKLSNIKHLMQ